MTPAPVKPAHRRRAPAQIAPAIEEQISCFAQQLGQQYPDAFRNPKAKHRAAAIFRRYLPPLSRRSGRPGIMTVSKALRLRHEAKRRHPERSDKEIWRRIYPRVIPNFHGLPLAERRDAEAQLRQRVRWRLSARRRRRRA